MINKSFLSSLFFLTLTTLIWGGTWRFMMRDPQVQGITTDLSPSEIISLTNLERAKAGVTPLKPNSQLEAAALSKAQDMVSRDYFSHQDPDGKGAWELILNAGYQYQTAGENLGRNFTTSTDLVNAWMSSPSHKANLLGQSYTEIGLAIIENKREIYIVELLASPLTSGQINTYPNDNFTSTKPLTAFRFMASRDTTLALLSLLIAMATVTAGYQLYQIFQKQVSSKKPGWELWRKV